MKVIQEHIKNQTFSPVYLLYGSEAYLKKLYRDKLKTAIMGDGDQMNFSYFEGKGIDEGEIRQIADTLPFFSEHRLVIIENSGWFKNSNEIADYIATMPASTYIVFIETEVDKRNRLYKAVKGLGTISEMTGMDEASLKMWVASGLKRDQKKVTDATVTYFLDKVGTDMEMIRCELEKVICYCIDREVITKEDIDAICSDLVIGKVFAMIDAAAAKKCRLAFELYFDLIAVREKPMTILYLIIRQINTLLSIKQLNIAGADNKLISSKAGVPPFAVSKYINQSKNFSIDKLKQILLYGTEAEESVKTGRLQEQIALELTLLKIIGN